MKRSRWQVGREGNIRRDIIGQWTGGEQQIIGFEEDE